MNPERPSFKRPKGKKTCPITCFPAQYLPCCAPLPSVAPFPSFPHSPDASATQRDDRPTLRPTSFRSLRQRGAPFIAPDVALHSACYGSGRCIRPASATAKPPHGPLPFGQPAAHRRPTAPLPCRARPPKGPHAARQHLLMRPQATGWKMPARLRCT